jgi:hypothetical protein
MEIEILTKTLAASLAPVAWISGVGLLIVSMTNRLGRAIDRLRALRTSASPSDLIARAEYHIHTRRAHRLRLALFFAGCSLLCTSLMIPTIFATVLLNSEWVGLAVVSLFSASSSFLAATMVCYMLELWIALAELNPVMLKCSPPPMIPPAPQLTTPPDTTPSQLDPLTMEKYPQ